MSLVDEIGVGLEMMKYSINHAYKFSSYKIAFASGFFSLTSSLIVEIANIFVICAANDTISVVFNFIALAIIAEFDRYFYMSIKNEPLKLLLERECTEKLLIIQHTTSKKCKIHEKSDIKYGIEAGENEDPDEYRPMKITFGSRTMCNRLLYIVYKFFKTFYVSIFFYFMPFSAILISTILPLEYRFKTKPPTPIPPFGGCDDGNFLMVDCN